MYFVGAHAAEPPPTTLDQVAAEQTAEEDLEAAARGTRFGFSAGIGAFPAGRLTDLGIGARFGGGLTESLDLSVDLGFTFGVGFGLHLDDDRTSGSVRLLLLAHAAPLVEFREGPVFVGAGPLLALGTWTALEAASSQQGGGTRSYVAGGLVPGGVGRVGLVTAGKKALPRRSGFSAALDVKVFTSRVVAGKTGDATSALQTGDRVWAWTPMFVLGYDRI